jgi:GT2 family glycosyltransferase
MRSGIAAAIATAGMRERPRLVFQHVDFVPGPIVGRAVRAAAAQADVVVCSSQALAGDLRGGDNVVVIHPGVDLTSFEPSDAERGAEALVLGAIVPWKRPDLALEAVGLAARELPDLKLTIAGAPLDAGGEALLGRLRERAQRPDLAGRVEFTGPLADPREALREAGCLLHCAEREPFGLVLVEALASGTPVVAPASGGPAEIVDESCGTLYRPGDADAAAAGLVRVLRGDRAMHRPARRRAEERFSLDRVQAEFGAVVEGARGPRGTAGAEPPDGAVAGSGIALVTVTFNSAPELRLLAASVHRHLPGARLVVVDSASEDDSVEVAREAGAEVIPLGENHGFGYAANAGVAAVDEPVTVLINPDVELIDASLAELARAARPGLLLAPLLLNADGSRQDSVHPEPASAGTALHAVIPGPLLPGPLRRLVAPWQSRRPRRVGWATAACLVAETETLRRLGPFDESIFLYAEDLDLGLRAETWFHPEARVIHTGAHSTTPAFGGEAHDVLAKQRREVVARRLGDRRARADDAIEMVTFAERWVVRRLLFRRADREAARFRARRAARGENGT